MEQTAKHDDDSSLDNEEGDGALGVIVGRIPAFQYTALRCCSEGRSCRTRGDSPGYCVSDELSYGGRHD